ncbi:UDP-N-acetylmuramoyl-L-alanine--D-glutamate ligase [Corallincola luteus]|uniref:UDP-N-acetylmuramoylalanine--D-glutamate ligase n=1 Tax=Corallincola luteus TaxID=1775177 RepID=A0ABY2ALL9_9GAMM|nr:UDP-N-acetylmuramoyl-L-alanine--D-glutamate ligase [Corallincola luteus]TCI03785.1 UDP-N-acetylmuramoyl-L-alanine--D-glutamate ligase [Corallincola luteus]
MIDYGGQQIVIVGLGQSGVSCARFLRARGACPLLMDTREMPAAYVNAPDLQGLPTCFGGLNEDMLLSAELIVVSPGLSLKLPALSKAMSAGIDVVGDIELFAREVTAPVVAITGSNGKSTVTTLLGEMAHAARLKVAIAGNIGIPALDQISPEIELYVLELSSFQLETTSSLNCIAATVLNVSEDHMDRYDDLASYSLAKQRVYAHAENIVFNRADSQTWCSRFLTHGCRFSYGLDAPRDSESIGIAEHQGVRWLMRGDKPLIAVSELKLLGAHNLANVAAAMALATLAGIPLSAMKEAVRSFKGLAHRCEFVCERNGVIYVNDSKATNVGATEAAISGLVDSIDGQLILLAGGDGKGADFAPLQAALAQVDCLITFGRDGEKIAALKPDSHEVAVLEQAVAKACHIAQPGDVVLLSPACASFDQFQSFEHRGQRFAQLVQEATV